MEKMIKTESQSTLGDFKFTVSDVEVCRICLVTDVKMHSLQDTRLGNCMKSIAGFTASSVGLLPNYVCYECAPIVLKSAKLIEKSKTAEASLLDIFEKHGQITKNLIKELNRSQLKLQSPLDSYLLQNYYYIRYDDENSTSEFIPTEPVPNIKMENKYKTEIKKEDSDDDSVEEIKVDNPVIEVESSDGESNEDFISLVPHRLNEKLKPCKKGISSKFHRTSTKKKHLKRKARENTDSTMWLEFVDIQQYFIVNKIPLKEQIIAWTDMVVKEKVPTGTMYICSFCQKSFSNADLLQAHSYYHDTRIHGEARCGVCQVCFSTSAALEYHTETIHANRFHCKFCPMVLNNIDEAKHHKNFVCVGSTDYRGPNRNTPPTRGPRPHQSTPSHLPPRMRNQQNWCQRH